MKNSRYQLGVRDGARYGIGWGIMLCLVAEIIVACVMAGVLKLSGVF